MQRRMVPPVSLLPQQRAVLLHAPRGAERAEAKGGECEEGDAEAVLEAVDG